LGISSKEILTEVNEVGGVAVAAHPCRKARPTKEYLIRKGYCRIVEGINGRNQEHENQMALSLYQNYPVSFVGVAATYKRDRVVLIQRQGHLIFMFLIPAIYPFYYPTISFPDQVLLGRARLPAGMSCNSHSTDLIYLR